MLLPTLEWLVALLMLETLSEECCLRMRRSVAWEVPFPGDPRSKTSGAADFAPSFAPGFTPKFTHPGTTSCFPLDLTCCSQMLSLRSLSRWGPCPLWSVKGELFSFCPTEVGGGSVRIPPHLLSWALDTTACPQVAATVACVVSAPPLFSLLLLHQSFHALGHAMPMSSHHLTATILSSWDALLPLFCLASSYQSFSHHPSLTFPGGLPSELTLAPEITLPPKAVRPK